VVKESILIIIIIKFIKPIILKKKIMIEFDEQTTIFIIIAFH